MDHQSATPRDTRLAFTNEQRRKLGALGLLIPQVDALENTALLIGAAALSNEDSAPARADVMDEFDRVANALEAARKALSELEDARDEVLAHIARVQVRGRIEMMSYAMERGIGEDGLRHKVLYGIAALQAIVGRAKSDVPEGPTRRKTASPFPVSLIFKALVHGWAVAHRGSPSSAEFNFQVSAGLKSTFRQVVQICYEAMGRVNDDPDRAIKGFMKWQREEQNARRVSDVLS